VAIVFKKKWALHAGVVAGTCTCTCIGTCTWAVVGTGTGPGTGKVIRWTCVGGIDHMKTTSIESKDQWEWKF